MPRQKRVFIASSGKAIPLAGALVQGLAEQLLDCEIREWFNPQTFPPTEATLQGLIDQASQCDFAAVLLTKDDFLDKVAQANAPEQNSLAKLSHLINAPRDNTIFELGLFMGALGASRCFMVCSADEDALPSDLKGITYIKIAPAAEIPQGSDCRGYVAAAVKRIAEIIKKTPCLTHPELPLITRAELADLETSRDDGGNLLLEPDTIAVVVNSVEPVEGRDPKLAIAVLKNMRAGAKYEYFYGGFTNNVAPTANLLQKLAITEIASQDTAVSRRTQAMRDNWDKVWPNLLLMKRNLSIHFRRRPPLQFCVHNALSEENAICYLRYEGEKFARWAERDQAMAIAEELTTSCTTHDRAQSIFHSTVDFRLAEDPSFDEAVNKVIRGRRETILKLMADRFPTDLPSNLQANLDKIWLES